MERPTAYGAHGEEHWLDKLWLVIDNLRARGQYHLRITN